MKTERKNTIGQRNIFIILLLLTVVSILHARYRIDYFIDNFDKNEIEVIECTFVDSYIKERYVSNYDEDDSGVRHEYYIKVDVDGDIKTFKLKASSGMSIGDKLTLYKYHDSVDYSEEELMNKLTKHYYILPLLTTVVMIISLLIYRKKFAFILFAILFISTIYYIYTNLGSNLNIIGLPILMLLIIPIITYAVIMLLVRKLFRSKQNKHNLDVLKRQYEEQHRLK